MILYVEWMTTPLMKCIVIRFLGVHLHRVANRDVELESFLLDQCPAETRFYLILFVFSCRELLKSL